MPNDDDACMANAPFGEHLTTRDLIASIANLGDAPIGTAMNAHGALATPPSWLEEYVPNVQDAVAPLELIMPESQHDAFVAFAASRKTRHVVSAVRLVEDPDQLQQLHLIAVVPDDPDGTGEPLTICLLLADDNAVPYTDTSNVESVKNRWIGYRSDELGNMISFDPTIEEMLGWTAADLLGENSLGIIHPDDNQAAIDAWLTTVTVTHPVRCRQRRRTKSGEWMWFELTTTNLLATEGYVRCELLDITAEMQMFEELTKQEEILRQLTDALPSGVAHFDRDGLLVFANERLAEITGVLHGKLDDYLELFDPATQDDIREMAYTIYRDAIEVDMEATLHRNDGQARRTRLAFRPLLNDHGDGRDGASAHSGAGGLLICVDDITESWTLRIELARQAATDGLTGIANRQSAHNALSAAMADRRSEGTGVIYFDLNGFKAANDRDGHAHGDALLVRLAKRLQDAARETDTVGRVGGDEFIVVAPNTTSPQLARLAKRLLDAVTAPDESFEIDAACGYTFVPSTAPSTGAQSLDLDPIDAEQAISEADAAMYVHKRTPGPLPVQYHESFTHSGLSDEREAS